MKKIMPVFLIGALFCVLIVLAVKDMTSYVEFKDTTLPVVKGKSWQKVSQDGYTTRVLELEHGWLVQDHGITFVPKTAKQ
jgi:hypothetical protein